MPRKTRTRRAKPCPTCKSASDTTRIVVKLNGDIIRTRKCLGCGHVWPTVELDLPATGSGSLRVAHEVKKLRQAIATASSPTADGAP
jgi:uncharacterized Zn finger protein